MRVAPSSAIDGNPKPGRFWLHPMFISYAMGPAALVTLVILRQLGYIAQTPIALWLGVFIAIPVSSWAMELYYRKEPTRIHLHERIAVHAAAVTVVIYLSGWGPVLVAAFAFVALENVSHDGSSTWKVTALWSMIAIATGELLTWAGWFPSRLPVGEGAVLAVMGAFITLFIIRMAGATVALKEDAEQSMRTSEDRFRSLVQNSSDTTFVIGDGRAISYASPACQALLGFPPEDIIGRDALSLAHPDDRERVAAQLTARLQASATATTEATQFRMSHADGTWRYVEAVVTDQRDRPSVSGYVANLRDITERKQVEDQLAHQALHDPLTGLPNRTLILDRAEQMLMRSRREYRPVAALFIDLDNFKDINDTLGHDAGDCILRSVADRLVQALRSSDTVGRLGGDEFVVLVEGPSLASEPSLVADRLREALKEPFQLESFGPLPLRVSASIGIAAGLRDSASDMLRDADIALYEAKGMGKDCAVVFEPKMQHEVLDRLELDMDLRSALGEDQFFLLYQPVFDLTSTAACGVEALLRWRHPTRGVVGPNRIIPLLEETGMIIDVGSWVIREACDQAAKWHRMGYTPRMSVNISMRQLESDGLVEQVADALATSGLAPEFLVLEVTETMLMRDPEATVTRLGRIKGLGVRIAIDDFGTGYSSFANLREFPVDALKIDRSFVAAMANSDESLTLIHSLVELGRALGLETLAEGIEQTSQLEILQAENCQLGQGFLFSRPVDAETAETFLVRSDEVSENRRPAPLG
jgi:diguanylate cyclase (GGDEF)-like protein/PAS domain S-box-containing protein